MANTIYRGFAEDRNIPKQVESSAAAAMKPGRAVLLDASGQFVLNGSDGAAERKLVVKEKGQGISAGSIEETFEVDSSVEAYECLPGQVYQFRFASGVALEKDRTLLTFGTSGQLKIATPATDFIVAVAKQTVTTAAADELATVEIL